MCLLAASSYVCMCIANDIQEYRSDPTGRMLGSGAFTYAEMCRKLSPKKLSKAQLWRRWLSLHKVGGIDACVYMQSIQRP